MDQKLRIGLWGFGKTGKAVAAVLAQSDDVIFEWVVRSSHNMEHRSATEFLGITSEHPAIIYAADEFRDERIMDRQPVDVIIDFSSQDGILSYGPDAVDTQTAIVSAISHYDEAHLEYLREIANGTTVLWSPNITVGVNFLIIASRVLKQIAPYTDIEIIEEHFKAKPELSGTAKKIAEALDIENDQIKMIRAGGIIGRHEALFGFPYQTVRISHESISREAFGNGALFAAKNIRGLAPGLYTMEDLLKPYFTLS